MFSKRSLLTCLALGPGLVLGQDKAAVQTRIETAINSAFSNKDANAIGTHIASIYNEGGVSKDELIRQLSALFKSSTVQLQFHVLDFHQFPGKNIGYFKTSSEIRVSEANAAPKELKTSGFASAIKEGTEWKIVATQPAACPHIQNFSVEAERGDWVGWGSQLNPAGLVEATLPSAERPMFALGPRAEAAAGAPKFDQDDWQKRYEGAWSAKNAQEILNFYAADYNEFGVDKTGLGKSLRDTFARFEKIQCKYRVVGIRYLPGTKLASLKAAIDLQGQAKGSGSLTPILQVTGYASLMTEGGKWKVYATQLFTTPAIGTVLSNSEWPPKLDVTVSR
jgi:hypothetical protein